MEVPNLQIEAVFEEELSRCSLAAQQELGGNLQERQFLKRRSADAAWQLSRSLEVISK